MQSIGCNKPGSNWIQMDIIQKGSQIFIPFHDQAFESPLKDMPAGLDDAIESISECALQPLHTHRQIGFRRLQSQVVVILQGTIPMQDPAGAFAGGEKRLLENPFDCIRKKDGIAVVATIENVIYRTGIFYT